MSAANATQSCASHVHTGMQRVNSILIVQGMLYLREGKSLVAMLSIMMEKPDIRGASATSPDLQVDCAICEIAMWLCTYRSLPYSAISMTSCIRWPHVDNDGVADLILV